LRSQSCIGSHARTGVLSFVHTVKKTITDRLKASTTGGCAGRLLEGAVTPAPGAADVEGAVTPAPEEAGVEAGPPRFTEWI
jgi:hypothetical protein